MNIGLLGPLEVRITAGSHADSTGAPADLIEVSGARLRLLLTLLALEAPRPISAGTLVDALWEDEPPADQSNALQSLVSRLRKALGRPELIQQSAAGYQLAVDADDVDVHRFDRVARLGRTALRGGHPAEAADLLTEALGLWRGEPAEIAGSGHGGALLARIEEQLLDARADLIEARLALGHAAEVVAELEGLVVAHPLRQRFAVLHMRALHAAGRPGEALASYERTRGILAGELGVDPAGELQAAHLDVLRDEPATPATPERRTNLRATLTSFVGRDEQLVQIDNLLAEARLITLVGPGGAGKTRLAAAAATALAADGAAEVWLIELAPVTNPADVPQTVLGSLGLRDTVIIERTTTLTSRDATTRLLDALAPRSAVLVLDNCEHLIDAAARLTDRLLAHCPHLQILATSREPLGIFGEALVVVPPLGQPVAGTDPRSALAYPAVRLFADRAQDVQAGFEVDNSTIDSVIEIVRRLDGLPLAIELAAARLRSLPVTEIERRLSDRFRLLTGGSRTAMPRHQTLRAVVQWSWDLLDDTERLLAERLAVFVGGITASAATAVCSGDDLDRYAVEDLLTALVDRSLLQVVCGASAAPRYRMLETIREYGIERLADRGEVGAVRLAHAEHFAAVVAEADPHLRGQAQLEWLAILEDERDNILAALKFFGDDGRAAAALDLVNLLGWYWMTIGNHSEIVTWVTFALALEGEADPIDRLMSEALLAINEIAWDTSRGHDEVEAGLKQLAAVSDQLSNAPPDAPKMMTLLAPIVATFSGNTDQVGPATERALNHPDPWIAAAVRAFRASLAENEGDAANMRANAEQALVVFRELGERWGMANCLQLLGQIELMEGDLDGAAAAYGEAIELATELGGREDVSLMRLRLADILTRQGDITTAHQQTELAKDAAAKSGSPIEVLYSSIVEAEIARTAGDLTSAAVLSEDAIAQLRQLPSIHPIHAHMLAVILASAAKIAVAAGDLTSARGRLDEAYPLALGTTDMPIVATVGVAVAMLAEQLGQPAEAAEMLGAAAQLRGADDATHPDLVDLDGRLGGLQSGPHADAYERGKGLDRPAAIERVDPASLPGQARRA